MALAQCCSQGHDQKPSFGQKVSEMASRAFKKEDSRHGHTAAQTYTQTKAGHSLGQANNAQNFTSGKARNGKTKKKKSLFEKIKDGISGHSDSGSGMTINAKGRRQLL